MVDSSSIAFWGILGGMSLLCVATIVMVYFICFSRNPRYCMLTEGEDLLETTIHQEDVHTVTSETRTTGSDTEDPTVVRRPEQTHKVTTRQRSRGNIFQAQTIKPITKIRVSPPNDSPHKHSEGSYCDHEDTRIGHNLTTPRPGMPQLTAIGASQS